MKRLFMAILALAFSGVAYADGVARSSFTISSDTALIRSVTSTNTIPTTLTAVVVSSPSANGVLKIYSSTFTTSNQVAAINLGTVGTYPFYDVKVKGIYYVITGNVSGVTIIYKY